MIIRICGGSVSEAQSLADFGMIELVFIDSSTHLLQLFYNYDKLYVIFFLQKGSYPPC
jgi:hypothetical protein